jgi:hypothetical protein
MSMPDLAEIVDRLTAAGYRHDFRAEEGGLRAVAGGVLYAPEELLVDEVVRLEGPSDPGEEAIVLAMRTADGRVRGTYVTAYGPMADALDAALLPRLLHGPHG